jgi:hypothetical protein
VKIIVCFVHPVLIGNFEPTFAGIADLKAVQPDYQPSISYQLFTQFPY